MFCGPSMVFTNVINPRSEIERKHEYRPTRVRRGATLGANCTIVCGITIGEYAFIGAGAVVVADVPDYALMVGVPGLVAKDGADYALMVGVPARQIGWMSRHGERLELPLEGAGSTTCPHTGLEYRLEGGRVRAVGGPPSRSEMAQRG